MIKLGIGRGRSKGGSNIYFRRIRLRIQILGDAPHHGGGPRGGKGVDV